MGNLKVTINSIFKFNIIDSFLVIVFSIFLYKLINSYFIKKTKIAFSKNKISKKSQTYLKLITNIFRYIFIILALIIILKINGIDVSSMLAGIGIVSVVIGLAIQDALKDIIRGFSILSDEYFSVDDIILYNNITGKVISIGLKATKIQDIATNNLITIANRNIEQVEIVSHEIYINIPLPYELHLKDSEIIIKKIIENIEQNNNVEQSDYLGINQFADSSIHYLIRVNCSPDKKLQVRRDSLRTILKTLEKYNISIPYQQIDIHTK